MRLRLAFLSALIGLLSFNLRAAPPPLLPPIQQTTVVIEGSPEGRLAMDVGVLLVDALTGNYYSKTTTRALTTGWELLNGSGGGGGNTLNPSANFVLYGQTDPTLFVSKYITNGANVTITTNADAIVISAVGGIVGTNSYNFSEDFTVTAGTNVAANLMHTITNSPAASGITADDLIPIIDDFAGTPTAQYATAAQIKTFVDTDVPFDISGTAIDPSLGHKVFSKNLTANTTFTFANLVDGQRWIVVITNGASWTLTWPTVTWPSSATPPVLDVGAGAVNIFWFLRSGGVTFGGVDQRDITTSAAWAAQLTDETGTGAAVFQTNAVLVTPTIASFTNATHTHLNAAGGGTLTSDAITSLPAYLVVAASDETTAITATANKVSFHMPFAMTLTSVRASLVTAQTSGATFTVDINMNGTSVLGTKLTIDNTSTTSSNAVAQATIVTSALLDDSIMTVDVDQIGDSTAKGLKVYLRGTAP